jgi:hypothetical protein
MVEIGWVSLEEGMEGGGEDGDNLDGTTVDVVDADNGEGMK